jgi:hypothetical protein
MDCLDLALGPPIEDVVKSIRQRSPRSAYINREIASLRAQEESSFLVDYHQFVSRFMDLRCFGLAIIAFNIHRVPFNHMPVDDEPGKWFGTFWPNTLYDWKKLQEFLELADNINQLATIFASVPYAEYHWQVMYSRALYLSHGTEYLSHTSSDMPDVPLTNRSFMDMIRIDMQISNGRSLPGETPTDNEGNPINQDFFYCVQQSLWIEELTARATNLDEWYHCNQLPDNEEIRTTVRALLDEKPMIDIVPFLRLVKWQRFSITAHKAGISDPRTMDHLFQILQEDTFFCLGVQGTAACLPRRGDSYELQYLLQLSSVNSQISLFLDEFDFDSQQAWYDGWFEKYPVSGPINHVSLDIEYLREGEEDPDGQEEFFERGHEPETVARAIGLNEADINYLWGTDPELSFDSEHLDSFDWLFSWVGSQYDAEDVRAIWQSYLSFLNTQSMYAIV